MRIVCHVLTSLDFGGVEKRMDIIASFQSDMNFRHKFVAIGAGGAVERKLKCLGVDVFCLNHPTKIPSFSSILALARFFREHKPMVVHAHGAEANFHGLVAAWLARVPVRVGEEIGIPSHSAQAKFIFRAIYHLSNRVVGISNSVRNWLVESGEVPELKAVMIYNPVLLSDKARQNRIGDSFRIGFVGRLEPVKNPIALLMAFTNFAKKNPSSELFFIGDGSLRLDMEILVRDHDLHDQVRILGYQPSPVDFLLQCDIYVQPSISEGFGLALVEAMGCQLPVISTAVGGAPEIIEHGKTGWLLPVASPEAIESTLNEAYSLGREGLHAMGRNARESVLGRFEPKPYVETLESLYSTVAAENGTK